MRLARTSTIIVVAVIATAGPVGSPTLVEPRAIEGLQLERSSEDGVVVRLSLEDPGRFVVSEGSRVAVRTPAGWAVTTRPGWPELPVVRLYVGIPPGSEVRADAQVLRTRRIAGSALPVSSYGEASAQPMRRDDPAFYERRGGAYPARWAMVEQVGWLRDQPVASVVLHPYRQEGNTLRVASEMVVSVSFVGGEKTGGLPIDSAFESVHRSALVNYSEARRWRRAPAGGGRPLWDPPYPAMKLYLVTDGVYRCTGSWLAQRGAPLDSINPHTLKLYNRGQEVPLYVAGQDDQADTVFSTADWLVFWGEHWTDSIPQDPAHRTRIAGEFTRENVYWLS